MASNNAVFNGVSEGFRDMLADFAPVSEWVEWVESQKPPKNYPVYIHHLPHRAPVPTRLKPAQERQIIHRLWVYFLWARHFLGTSARSMQITLGTTESHSSYTSGTVLSPVLEISSSGEMRSVAIVFFDPTLMLTLSLA